MRAEIIGDVERLLSIEPDWWRLWSRQTRPRPFTTPAWLIPWWTAFGPGDLMSVAVWAGDRLVALAPLYLEQGPGGRRLLPLGISLSDYADVLVDPDHAATAWRALTGTMDVPAGAWDLWSMEEVPEDAALMALDTPAVWSEERQVQSGCPVLALRGQAGDLGHAVPAAMRRKWRMACHRLGRRSSAVETADPRTAERMLDALFRLHEARWRARGQGGVLLDPRVRRFHLMAAPRLAEAGLLRLRALTIEGRVAAVYYGVQDARCGYAYLGGFDPAFAFESPGTILIGAAIEECATAGLDEFHFLRGEEPYKFAWGATTRWNLRRTFRRRTR